MVSKASEDLPEPDRPVNTTSLSRGISTSMFFRLCSRAPRMVIARRELAGCWRRAFKISSMLRVPGGSLQARSEMLPQNVERPSRDFQWSVKTINGIDSHTAFSSQIGSNRQQVGVWEPAT